MGCGFCCVVPAGDAEAAVSLLAAHHPGAAVIGQVTDRTGVVELPAQGLVGDEGRGSRQPDLGRLPKEPVSTAHGPHTPLPGQPPQLRLGRLVREVAGRLDLDGGQPSRSGAARRAGPAAPRRRAPLRPR